MAIRDKTSARYFLRRAFTLVEILVVLVILGAITAIVIPQIGSRNDLRAAAAARIVVSDLVYAQNLAISRQTPMYVRFTATGYGIYDTAAGATPISHPINKSAFTASFGAGGTAGLTNCAISSTSFDGSLTLVFDEMGAPYSYNSVASTTTALTAAGAIVVGSGDYELRIEIEPFTGETTVTREP
jgi:prepilin-type N-terminal cleavage/methylation domain-containing protein